MRLSANLNSVLWLLLWWLLSLLSLLLGPALMQILISDIHANAVVAEVFVFAVLDQFVSLHTLRSLRPPQLQTRYSSHLHLVHKQRWVRGNYRSTSVLKFQSEYFWASHHSCRALTSCEQLGRFAVDQDLAQRERERRVKNVKIIQKKWKLLPRIIDGIIYPRI